MARRRRRETPAQRAKQRKHPAIALPPRPPEGERRSALQSMRLRLAGADYRLGPAIEGDPAMASAIDGTATLTVALRDPSGHFQSELDNEAFILQDGATTTINGVVYTLQSVSVDDTGTLVTLTFEDQVSWRLKTYRRFLAISRARATRAQAALRLIAEASAKPLTPIKYYIPELSDRQRIAQPGSVKATTSRTTTGRGTGADPKYTVKHVRATATQRAAIDAILSECARQGASRRVMVAAIMAATQEATMLPRAATKDGAHLGLFQQDKAYGSSSKRFNPTTATQGFLNEWKRIHGSVKTVRGDLATAIERVERPGRAFTKYYAQWQAEATQMVDRWRGAGGSSGLTIETTRTVAERYEFTRGERNGQAENSWDALARWAEEVGWRRWAEGNVLYYLSDDELRAAAPSLQIDGDEPWLLAPPAFDWGVDRPVSEVRVRVLAERWGVQIGAVVVIASGPAQGRYIVAATEGAMVSPEVTVTLRRPQAKRPEPPHQTREVTDTTRVAGGGPLGSAGTVYEAARRIDGQGLPYAWGGGHPHAGTPSRSIRAGETQVGYDCSGCVGAALAAAGLGFHLGQPVPASGTMAASYGLPGKGEEFTVWANGEHVWMEFHRVGHYARLDTSPYGDGPRGPHVRTRPRPTAGFTPRHWRGH
jgi:hypothetical protein